MNTATHKMAHLGVAAAYLLLLMVLTSVASAQTSVSFVGELDAYAGYYQPAGDDDLESKIGLESNGMTTSFLGAHGSQELGDGIKAIAALELFLRPDSAELGRFEGDIMFARAAYVGLEGDFGKVTIGRNASLYFLSTIIFNPFGDSFAFSPMVQMSFGGGGLYGDTGWSDSIVYSLPTMGGFSTSLAYAFGEEPGDTGTNKIAANTFYQAGDFGLTAAVQKISGTQPGAMGLAADDSQTDALLGLSYAMGKNTFFVQYQMMSDDLAMGDIDRDTLVLSASIAAGKGAVYLSYGITQTSTDTGDFDRDIYTLVYNYPLGPKLDLYAAFSSDDPDWAEQSGTTLGFGGRFRF